MTLLDGRPAEAEAVLRELCAVAPAMLRATLDSWGYSPSYCRLEQLWIEAYAGMVGSMVAQAAEEAKRREGVAMAHSLYSLLAGRMQFRFLRHAVADWALALAPASPRALFMKGEAILEQPLPGQSGAADSEPWLRAAARAHTEGGAAAAAAPAAASAAAAGAGAAGASSSFEIWQTLARSIDEAGGDERQEEMMAVLRDGIAHHPDELELYLTLGHVLERRGDTDAALEVYSAFPPPPPGRPPGFDHAMAASQIAKLLIERRAFESRLLVESLVVVGRRLGVLNIEKYVIALDLADQVEAIKEIYYRISPDVDQTTFFRHKGWYYDRSAASEREARAAEADAEAEPRAEPD
eukprot:Transcript_2330.p1 GENE.Transcript_2330~~Transcript_2330.p1  ORF type:complete len:352 (+),score=127.81 Transcript_2330:2-1057(+)